MKLISFLMLIFSAYTFANEKSRNLTEKEKEIREAVKFFKSKCEKKDGKACFWLGEYFELNKKKPENELAMSIYLQKGCDYGHGQSCFKVGVYFQNDPKLMFEFFQKGCKHGHARSCFNGGVLHEANKRLDLARLMYTKACEKNYGSACFNLGNYSKGIGEYNQAITYFKKACENEQKKGCSALEELKKSEMKEKLDTYANSCEESNISNCRLLVAELESQGYILEAKKKIELNCNTNKSIMCSDLGQLYRKQNDWENAKKFYKIACDELKEKSSCHNLGAYYFKSYEFKLGKEFLSKACRLGFTVSCEFLKEHFK